MKYTKSIFIGSIALIAGVFGINNLIQETPTTVQPDQTYTLQISDDQTSPFEVLRIVPSEVVPFFPEESFTLNDIISEIETEKRINGESERYSQLEELQNAVSEKLHELPARPEVVDKIDLTKPEPEI